MYKICDDCNKNYIEEDEDICIKCSVYNSIDIEYFDKSIDEEIVDTVDGDTLNDMGVSLS